jgi:Zn-dependent peptidase ImmA (M78 family)
VTATIVMPRRLETAARDGANRILDIHHPKRTAPIPLLQILQDAGYRLGQKRNPTSITAFYIRDGYGHSTIGLNTRQSPRSQRYSIAHAMAHGELHDAELLICLEVRSARADGRGLRTWPSDAMERQAHLFALELLMPADTVCGVVDASVGDTAHPHRDSLVKRVAEAFEVPESAAAYRLIDLAILGP